MTKEIKDADGNLVAIVTLPDSATEQDWEIIMSAYIPRQIEEEILE